MRSHQIFCILEKYLCANFQLKRSNSEWGVAILRVFCWNYGQNTVFLRRMFLIVIQWAFSNKSSLFYSSILTSHSPFFQFQSSCLPCGLSFCISSKLPFARDFSDLFELLLKGGSHSISKLSICNSYIELCCYLYSQMFYRNPFHFSKVGSSIF